MSSAKFILKIRPRIYLFVQQNYSCTPLCYVSGSCRVSAQRETDFASLKSFSFRLTPSSNYEFIQPHKEKRTNLFIFLCILILVASMLHFLKETKIHSEFSSITVHSIRDSLTESRLLVELRRYIDLPVVCQE